MQRAKSYWAVSFKVTDSPASYINPSYITYDTNLNLIVALCSYAHGILLRQRDIVTSIVTLSLIGSKNFPMSGR